MAAVILSRRVRDDTTLPRRWRAADQTVVSLSVARLPMLKCRFTCWGLKRPIKCHCFCLASPAEPCRHLTELRAPWSNADLPDASSTAIVLAPNATNLARSLPTRPADIRMLDRLDHNRDISRLTFHL